MLTSSLEPEKCQSFNFSHSQLDGDFAASLIDNYVELIFPITLMRSATFSSTCNLFKFFTFIKFHHLIFFNS